MYISIIVHEKKKKKTKFRRIKIGLKKKKKKKMNWYNLTAAIGTVLGVLILALASYLYGPCLIRKCCPHSETPDSNV